MKHLTGIVMLCLLTVTVSETFGQSRQEDMGYFRQVDELVNRERSAEELEKACAKLQRILQAYKRAGDERFMGYALHRLGKVCELQGNYDLALQDYTQALEIFQKLKDRPYQGIIVNRAGIVHESMGNYDKAISCYSEALAINRESGNTKGVGDTLNNLGIIYLARGENDKALDCFKKSMDQYNRIGNRWDVGKTLLNIGIVYKNLCRYDEAIKYSEQSLKIVREFRDSLAEANALNVLGNVYEDGGHTDKAVQQYLSVLSMRKKMGDRFGEIIALSSLGNVYLIFGQYVKAMDYHEKALKLAQEAGQMSSVCDAFKGMGLVYFYWGRHGKALQHYHQALEIAQRLKVPISEADMLECIGRTYRNCGLNEKAEENYKAALAIYRDIKNPQGEGSCLENLGKIMLERNEYNLAQDCFRECLKIRKTIGVPTASVEDSIGNTYFVLGRFDEAEEFIKRANYQSSLGLLALSRGNYQEARIHYSKVLENAVQNRDAENLFIGYTGLGLVNEALKKDLEASEFYQKAIDHTEELRSALPGVSRETFFVVRIGGFVRTTPYEGYARVMLRMKRPWDALRACEYAKARAFAEAISRLSEGLVLDVPHLVVQKDGELNNQLAALKLRKLEAYEKNNKEVADTLESQIRLLESEMKRHMVKLRQAYPLFAATRYPVPLDLDQTMLLENEWVLSYKVTDPGVIIFLTKGKNIVKTLLQEVGRKELDVLIKNFRQSMEMPVSAKDKITEQLEKFDFVSGKKLSDLLLGDILSELPAGVPVVIIPDDSLGVVPFEMLVLNSAGEVKTDKPIPYISGAEFFGDRNQIVYYQSITSLTLARTLKKKDKPGDRLLVMADPVFEMKDQRAQGSKPTKVAEADKKLFSEFMATVEDSSGGRFKFSRLSLTGDLAKALGNLFPGKADTYTGIDASKENLFKKIAPKLSQYGSIVFATHGYFKKDNPIFLEPILALTTVPPGTDGFLRMSEVMGLKLNADIVALTACQTGLGRNISGEGTMGMGRAFQYAGAASVLMTLWNVEQTASVKLVESFFKNFKEGKTKLQALQEARSAIRSQGYDHPAFWAAFILVGEMD